MQCRGGLAVLGHASQLGAAGPGESQACQDWRLSFRAGQEWLLGFRVRFVWEYALGPGQWLAGGASAIVQCRGGLAVLGHASQLGAAGPGEPLGSGLVRTGAFLSWQGWSGSLVAGV